MRQPHKTKAGGATTAVLEQGERSGEDEMVVVWAAPEPPRQKREKPRACLMDWLITLSIGLQITGAAVCFIVAVCVYDALLWWAFRTMTGAPLMLLGGALVARSLKRRDRSD